MYNGYLLDAISAIYAERILTEAKPRHCQDQNCPPISEDPIVWQRTTEEPQLSNCPVHNTQSVYLQHYFELCGMMRPHILKRPQALLIWSKTIFRVQLCCAVNIMVSSAVWIFACMFRWLNSPWYSCWKACSSCWICHWYTQALHINTEGLEGCCFFIYMIRISAALPLSFDKPYATYGLRDWRSCI